MAQSLLFIPDISGFTNFVKSTEINHSRHIISELLEILIEANRINLEISEIEGDAILFFKSGEIPSLTRITEQVEKMFLAFHGHLKRYDHERICHCGACSTASQLSLKIIVHLGDIDFIKVKDYKKLHGHDVIIAHRLLKNSLKEKEYLLISAAAFSGLEKEDETTSWTKWKNGSEIFDKIGKIEYSYSSLADLHKNVKYSPVKINSPKTTKPLREEILIKRNIYEVYEILTNLDLRLSWNEGLDALEYKKKRVNRVGTKHVCLIGSKKIEFETVTNDFGQGRLVYGERLLNFPVIKDMALYYLLEKEDNSTRLIMEAHFEPLPIIGFIILPFIKKTFQKNIRKTIAAFKHVCENQHSDVSVEHLENNPLH